VRQTRAPWYDHFVTTTESELAGCAGYTPDVNDPMRLWLESNGIEMDQIPMWPAIELRDGQMRIERMAKWDREQENRMLGRPHIYLSGWFDLRVPMPDELWELYQRNRDQAATAIAMAQLGRAGATVVHLHGGDELMFVTADRDIPPGEVDQMSARLQSLLPRVNVTIIAGVDTVLHRAGTRS